MEKKGLFDTNKRKAGTRYPAFDLRAINIWFTQNSDGTINIEGSQSLLDRIRIIETKNRIESKEELIKIISSLFIKVMA